MTISAGLVVVELKIEHIGVDSPLEPMSSNERGLADDDDDQTLPNELQIKKTEIPIRAEHHRIF